MNEFNPFKFINTEKETEAVVKMELDCDLSKKYMCNFKGMCFMNTKCVEQSYDVDVGDAEDINRMREAD